MWLRLPLNPGMEEGYVAVGHPAWSGVQGGAGVSLPMPLSGPCIIFCLVLCSTFASLFQGRKERGSLLGSRNRDAKVKVWI